MATIITGGEVILKNGISFKGGGSTILNGLISDLFDQDLISAQYKTDLMSKLGLVYTKPLNQDQTFDIMVGTGELDEIKEGENLPIKDISKGKGKGFELKIYGEAYKVTKQFVKWVQTAKTLQGADSSVMSEWARIAHNIKNLDRAKIKTMNKLFAELLIKGKLTSNLYGPGSLTPYGQPLFSTAHPFLAGTKTFSNYYGAYALSATDATAITTSRGYIKGAIDMLKNGCRLQNGDYIETPSSYDLLVPRTLETTAREVLNDGSKFAPDGNNANKLSVFEFQGSRINLVILDTIGGYDKNGNMIGTGNEWFLFNREGAALAQAARYIELYPAEINTYENNDNKNTYISIDMSCTVDHYGLESFIVGANIA